jgi:hypothetical protein
MFMGGFAQPFSLESSRTLRDRKRSTPSKIDTLTINKNTPPLAASGY